MDDDEDTGLGASMSRATDMLRLLTAIDRSDGLSQAEAEYACDRPRDALSRLLRAGLIAACVCTVGVYAARMTWRATAAGHAMVGGVRDWRVGTRHVD